jgi:hypothetical protein
MNEHHTMDGQWICLDNLRLNGALSDMMSLTSGHRDSVSDGNCPSVRRLDVIRHRSLNLEEADVEIGSQGAG